MYTVGTDATAISRALEDAAISVWRDLAGSKALVARDNEQFTAPNGTRWLQVAVRFGESAMATIGRPLEGAQLLTGILFLTVYGPAWESYTRTRELVDALRARFLRSCDLGVWVESSAGPIPINERSYYGEQVQVNFRAWEYVSPKEV